MVENLITYEFEGNAEVNCLECGDAVEVEFNGNDLENMTIDEAIKFALTDQGWKAGKCPYCTELEYNDNTDMDDEDDAGTEDFD